MDEREENMIERYNDIITYPYDQRTPPTQSPTRRFKFPLATKGKTINFTPFTPPSPTA